MSVCKLSILQTLISFSFRFSFFLSRHISKIQSRLAYVTIRILCSIPSFAAGHHFIREKIKSMASLGFKPGHSVFIMSIGMDTYSSPVLIFLIRSCSLMWSKSKRYVKLSEKMNGALVHLHNKLGQLDNLCFKTHFTF